MNRKYEVVYHIVHTRYLFCKYITDAYLWQDAADKYIPPDALIVDKTNGGNKVRVVCRASHMFGLYPGKLVTGKNCVIGYWGTMTELTPYEVLVQEPSDKFEWVHFSSGSPLPPDALQTGKDDQDRSLYTVRDLGYGEIGTGYYRESPEKMSIPRAQTETSPENVKMLTLTVISPAEEVSTEASVINPAEEVTAETTGKYPFIMFGVRK